MSATEALSHEFPVTIGSEEGFGVLIVTDLTLMVRPAVGERYYQWCPHDTTLISQVMDLGDWEDGSRITWHISTSLSMQEAHELMHTGWKAYFDYYCMAKTWIDVDLYYIGAGGEIIGKKGYGFSDAHTDGAVYIYTKAFWESVHESGDPAQADWAPLLKHGRLLDARSIEVIMLDEIEHKLGNGLRSSIGGIVVVVRPAPDTPNGFTARGFEIEME